MNEKKESFKELFGEFFKAKRIEKCITLRNFCRTYHLDPGNISKIERGILPPPRSKEKLEKYAEYLGIPKGTDDWLDFFDRAAACNGELPHEFLKDDELVKKLPLIFRTIRDKKVSQKTLDELVDLIRSS